jgi:hypothetical protein
MMLCSIVWQRRSNAIGTNPQPCGRLNFRKNAMNEETDIAAQLDGGKTLKSWEVLGKSWESVM